MAEINLNLNKNLFTPKFYPFLFDYSHRWQVFMGSAGSAKSWFITQKLIIKALNQPMSILVCRRYATTKLFKQVLDSFKIREFCKINESDFRIRFPNGSEIIFMGLDEETKLLSLADISTIFVEEAFEVSRDIIEQLNLRMRGQAKNQEIILAFNPISSTHWLYDFCEVNPPSNFAYIHSTYKDNPFLSDEYIETLEDLYKTNPAKAKIFCDGQWGVNTDGLVFSNWITQDFDIMNLAKKGLEHRVGADLGYVDASTIIETMYDRDNRIIYVCNEFYKTGCQLDNILEQIKNMKLEKVRIYFDSAEPRTIDYFKRNGVYAVPCIKGQGSVNARLAFLQNHKIIIHPSCKNVLREFENFSYIKDKKTNTYTDNTTHEFSHTIDGLGYAYSDIYTKSKLRTLNKSVLGL